MCDNLSGCEVCSSTLIAIISEEFTGCVAAPGDRECRAIALISEVWGYQLD